MCLIEEDAGMSKLARTRYFLVKFFLLLVARKLTMIECEIRVPQRGAVEYPTAP